MPAFAEMLVSQSPPVYSHTLSDYIASQTDGGSPFGFNGVPPTTRSYCRPASLQLTPPPVRRQVPPPSPPHSKMPASPRRSCLVIRPEDLSPEEERTIELHSPTDGHDKQRNKKKVVFADDQGGQLTQVRVMKEPSYMPPIWSLQFLAHVTQGMISPVPQEQWMVDFRQPASAYLEFRQKVDESKVSLENVIIKETDHLIVGTVKVKNISYHKEVVVRSSCDGWKTHEDTYCTYTVVGNGAASAYTLHDTFAFKLTLPPKSRRIEFCVCYKCEGAEFWDNNDGHNYSLTNRVMPRQDSSIFFPPHNAFSSSMGSNNNSNDSSTNNNNNSTSNEEDSTNSTNGQCSETTLNGYSSPFVDPTVELDTWRHMTSETHSGPYCFENALTDDTDGSDTSRESTPERLPAAATSVPRSSSSSSSSWIPATAQRQYQQRQQHRPAKDLVDGPPTSPLVVNLRKFGAVTVHSRDTHPIAAFSNKASNKNTTSSSVLRSGTACGDQFTHHHQPHLQHQHQHQQQQYQQRNNFPRDTGRHYSIRERKESEDLLVNLLNLRELLLNQNVHV